MRKIGLFVAAFILSVSAARAKTVVYTTPMVSSTALAYSTDVVIDLNSVGQNKRSIDDLSFVATLSSVTPSALTFTDGGVSTGSLTVVSTQSMTARASTDSITVAADALLTALPSTNTVTVVSTNGLTGATLTFSNGLNTFVLTNGVDWFSQNTASMTAVSIRGALDALPSIAAGQSGTSAVVFATADVSGLIGNAYTLTSSTPAALSVGSATFLNGRNPAGTAATITVTAADGVSRIYRAGYDFFPTTLSTQTATSIATLLNNITGIQAQAINSVVTATASAVGTAGNSFALSASTPAYAVASANFTGGRSSATVTINGLTLTNGTDFTAVSTASGTAKAISDAIMANATLKTIIASTWTAAGVVPTTSTAQGAGTTYSLATNTSSITVSGANMTGGSAAAWAINTGQITKTAHGLTTGLQVLFTGSPAIGGLTSGTTFFAIPVDANTFELALTSTGAQAGNFITLTSSSTAGPHTYTLTPLTFAGNWGYVWTASNDNTNFFTLPNISSVTYSVPVTTAWDGAINYRYLKFHFDAGTGGGMNIAVTPNGKNSN